MSLLTICQNAAEEIGFKKPATVISNTDTTAIRLLRIATRVGSVLAKKNWHELIKTYSFTTTASEPQYALPSDFRSYLNDTAWNQTTDTQMFLISPQRWSYEKSAVTSSYHDRFRLLGDDAGPDIGARFTIHPTPAAVETMIYEYYSKNWVTDAGGTVERSAFVADSDLVVFDEELFTMGVVWRMLKSIGQGYSEEKADYDNQVEICMAQSGATEKLHADGNIATLSNIPETGFG
jgi:hypothetical protein